jgi:nucleotide-binding universal stress UspA family protein
MYNKIVVPLDGSNLAEVVLPQIEKFASGNQIPEILLVSVTEKIQGRIPKGAFDNSPDPEYAQSQVNISGAQAGLLMSTNRYDVSEVPMVTGKMAKTAFDYLCTVADKLKSKGFKVTVNILYGNPAEEIVRFAEYQKAEVIMIGSRGKSGFSRWDLGNIAEKVIRATHAVVILVKPDANFKETRGKRKGEAM